MDGVPAGEWGVMSDDPPFDFVVHLAQRLGVDLAAAQATLREWLIEYSALAESGRAIRRATGV